MKTFGAWYNPEEIPTDNSTILCMFEEEIGQSRFHTGRFGITGNGRRLGMFGPYF